MPEEQLNERSVRLLIELVERLSEKELYSLGHLVASEFVKRCTKDDPVINQVRVHFTNALTAYESILPPEERTV